MLPVYCDRWVRPTDHGRVTLTVENENNLKHTSNRSVGKFFFKSFCHKRFEPIEAITITVGSLFNVHPLGRGGSYQGLRQQSMTVNCFKANITGSRGPCQAEFHLFFSVIKNIFSLYLINNSSTVNKEPEARKMFTYPAFAQIWVILFLRFLFI